MKLETKNNIGDVFYKVEHDEIKSFKIESMTIRILSETTNGITEHYKAQVNGSAGARREFCDYDIGKNYHKTPEEAAAKIVEALKDKLDWQCK